MTAFIVYGCNTIGFESFHVFGRDGNREIGFPVIAEIQEAVTPDLCDIEDAPLDQREPVDLCRCCLRVQDQIIGNAPDAGPAVPGPVFMGKHVCRQRPVVGEAVDPRQSVGEHARLDPDPVSGEQMREKAIVTIHPLAAESQSDRLIENQFFQRVLGFIGKWPCLETRPPQRQLGGLDSDKTDLSPIFQYDGIAIHHVDHPDRLTNFQLGAQGFGDVGTGRAEAGQNDKKNKRCAQDHHGRQYNVS